MGGPLVEGTTEVAADQTSRHSTASLAATPHALVGDDELSPR
jgi:hypothetical protein